MTSSHDRRVSDVVDATGPTQRALSDSPAPGAELAPGTKAGDYRIVRLIGRGGMGEVYQGVQDAIGKSVAVKVIRGVLADSDESCARFLREARAANRVGHRGVLDVFAAGRLDDGRLFLVMDLLRGRSLRQVLQQGGALSVADAVEILSEVCGAVGAANRAGIIHRDLKPDNIFIGESGESREITVLDFGIAKLLEDAARGQGLTTLTGQGAWMGTPAYMAPEQWSSEGASPASDVYSLGVVGHEMLSGSPPYQADSLPAMMEKHFHSAPPTLGGQVPPALEEVLNRALAKDPGDRFADAGELGAALRDAAEGRVVAPTVRGGGRPGKSPLRPAAAAAVVLGLCVAGLLLYRAASGGAKGGGEPEAKPAPALAAVTITSTPSGARVWIDGEEEGITPLRHEASDGSPLSLRLSKPGYVAVETSDTVSPGAELHYDLNGPVAFEGVWQIDNGELRSFRRDGDRVACYRLDVVDGPLQHLRFFEFQPSSDHTIHFAAAAEAVDPRAPNEPSCRRQLRAEYRYDPGEDALELRREGDLIDFVDGKCVRQTVQWSDFQPATRIAARTADAGDMTFSSAGAGTVAVDAVTSGGDSKEAPQAKAKKKVPQNKARSADFAPSKKNVPNPFVGDGDGDSDELAEEKGASAGPKPSGAPQNIEPAAQGKAPRKDSVQKRK